MSPSASNITCNQECKQAHSSLTTHSQCSSLEKNNNDMLMNQEQEQCDYRLGLGLPDEFLSSKLPPTTAKQKLELQDMSTSCGAML